MKTISAEQFKSLYGEHGMSQFAPQPAKSGIGATISNAFKSGINQVKEGFSQAKNAKNPLQFGEGLLKSGGGIAGAISSPLAPIIEPTIGRATNAIADTVGNIPEVQKFANSKAGEVTSRVAEDLTNAGAIAGTIAGGLKVPELGQAARTGITKFGAEASDSVGAIKQKINPAKNPVESAIEDATPNYESSTPNQRTKLLGRVEEGGMLKGRTVKPNALEIEAGNELSKVPGYDPATTKLQKYQVTKAEVGKRGQALESALENEKIIVPKKEIISKVQKAINEVPNKSLLLQKSDPVMVNYMRVLKTAINKEPGNLKGVLKLKKTLDDAYENARGKQAFGSDKISALDDVHKVARDVLTEYMIEKAQSVDVKASLRSQWNLYRALDQLKTAAEKESGSSVGRFKQNNPLLNKVGEMGVKAAGFGAGLGIIK